MIGDEGWGQRAWRECRGTKTYFTQILFYKNGGKCLPQLPVIIWRYGVCDWWGKRYNFKEEEFICDHLSDQIRGRIE